MGELERIREVMGFEPLRTVENPEDLPPGDAFRLFLPDIVPEGELELLTSFFLHRYHGEKPVSVNEDRFTDLERADAVMGGELLPSIVSRLRHLEKYTKLSGEKLTPELFRHIIQDMVYDHRVKLHPKDLRILNTLRKKPLTSIRSLSKLLGWSYTTTHRRVKRLRERCRLGVYPKLNYPRIGLTHLLILTGGEAHVESPYLLSRHELLGGDTYTLLSVAVPPRAVDRVFSSLEKRLPGVWTWTVEAFESVLTLDSYDPERGEWSINWDSWALTLYHALSRGWDQVIPQEDEYTPPHGAWRRRNQRERPQTHRCTPRGVHRNHEAPQPGRRTRGAHHIPAEENPHREGNNQTVPQHRPHRPQREHNSHRRVGLRYPQLPHSRRKEAAQGMDLPNANHRRGRGARLLARGSTGEHNPPREDH